jgi:hypothetical protein
MIKVGEEAPVRQLRFELRNEPGALHGMTGAEINSLLGQQVQVLLNSEMMTLL